MSNINLLQSAQEVDKIQKNKVFGKSFFVPIVILIFVFLILGGVKFYSSYLKKEKTNLDTQVQAEYASLNGKTVNRVIDFQERIKKATEEMSSKANYSECLKELENSTVSGSKIVSLEYSPSSVEMKIAADNFKTVARQVMSFKQSNCFKDLSFGSTEREESGSILFTLKK